MRYREIPNGPQRTKTFARKLDAQRFAEETAVALARGAYVPPTRLTFGQYVEQWLPGQVWRRSTSDRNRSLLDVHVLPELGRKQIGHIRPTDIRAMVAKLSTHLAPSTTEGVYRLVASILATAVADRIIPESPCRGVKLPRAERNHGALVPITPEELHLLADAITPELRRWVLVTASLGLRQGEACGLTLDRVNFLRRQVAVDRQLVTAVGFLGLEPTKTTASNRVLPLPPTTAALINEQIAEFGPGPHGLVFWRAAGASKLPWARQRITERMTKASRTASLSVTAHDLRHFAASALIAAGASVKAVQVFLGHSSATETLDTYGHLWPSDNETIVNALETFLRRSAIA